jgi:putative transposase
MIKTVDKIWLDRFWEHTIKNQDDYNRCVDYINLNPVKHGYVEDPYEWEHSSYNEYVRRGIYDSNYQFHVSDKISGAEFD